MTFYNALEKHLIDFHVVTHKKGETIYRADEAPRSLYIIKEGLVGLFHISENGKETFLRVFGKTQILGHRSLLAHENYHANAVCLQDTEFYQISASEFSQLLEKDNSLLRSITESLAKDLRVSELRISDLNDKSSYLRVVESIVYLKNKYPDQVWTRQEIAEFAVCTNETVTRTLTKLEKMNLIQKQGRDFSLNDTEGLLSLTNEDF